MLRLARRWASTATNNSSLGAASWFPETKLTTLSNGLRVATEQFPHGTATVGVFIKAGSRYETAESNGVAHFLEHIIFKVGVEAANWKG